MRKIKKKYVIKTKTFDKKDLSTIKAIIEMQNIIDERQRKSEKLQSKFNFKIPNYVIEELIKDNKNYDILNSMIGIAVVNGRLSREQAQILRKLYKWNNITKVFTI